MAKWLIYTPTQETMWVAWLASRPEMIREMAAKYNLRPDLLYRLKTTGRRVVLASLNEDGTVRVNVLEEFNPEHMPPMGGVLDRSVFGIDPADLEECDLPEGHEPQLGQDEDEDEEPTVH